MSSSGAKLSFQVSPLWLTGPPVASSPPGMVPIISITDPQLFQQVAGRPPGQGGIGSDTVASQSSQGQGNAAGADLDDAFGAFTVVPGGTLVKDEVAQFPFANQWVASNAQIFQPLEISLMWDVPMRGANVWTQRMSVITQLQAVLTNHINSGGTFTITTPSFIYVNLLMTNMSDASRGNSPIPQNAWRFDFVKPLIAITDLQAAQAALVGKVSAGLVTNGQWTGTLAGSNLPASLPQFITTGVLPATGALAGAGGVTVPSTSGSSGSASGTIPI
jgi:hypothetical protein